MLNSPRHPFDFMTEPEMSRLFTDVAKRVDLKLPDNTGFIVLAAPFSSSGGPGYPQTQFVSNIERKDAIEMCREFIRRAEAGEEVMRG